MARKREMLMRFIMHWLQGWGIEILRWLVQWSKRPARRRWGHNGSVTAPRRCVFAQPKPKWVKNEVIRLKAVMPEAGCRMIAHHFNRRWKHQRQMTVGKSYVVGTLKKHQYLSLKLDES